MNNFKKAELLLQKNAEDVSAIQYFNTAKQKGIKGRKKFVDDGRSIADMNIEGFSWYVSKHWKKEQNELVNLKLSKKELKAMILGAFSVVLPMTGFIAVMYAGAFLLISLWLK